MPNVKLIASLAVEEVRRMEETGYDFDHTRVLLVLPSVIHMIKDYERKEWDKGDDITRRLLASVAGYELKGVLELRIGNALLELTKIMRGTLSGMPTPSMAAIYLSPSGLHRDTYDGHHVLTRNEFARRIASTACFLYEEQCRNIYNRIQVAFIIREVRLPGLLIKPLRVGSNSHTTHAEIRQAPC